MTAGIYNGESIPRDVVGNINQGREYSTLEQSKSNMISVVTHSTSKRKDMTLTERKEALIFTKPLQLYPPPTTLQPVRFIVPRIFLQPS